MPSRRQVQGPTLPNPLRCGGCGQSKEHWLYSTEQLDKALNRLKQGEGLLGVTCRECLNSTDHNGFHDNQYLTCVVCGETKIKGEFSKANRRNPDNAQCEKCTLAHDHTSEMHARALPASTCIEPELNEYVPDYQDDDTLTNPYEDDYEFDASENHISESSVHGSSYHSSSTKISKHQGLSDLFHDEEEDEEEEEGEDATSSTATPKGGSVASAWNSVVSKPEPSGSGPARKPITRQTEQGNDGKWSRVPTYTPMDPYLNPMIRSLNSPNARMGAPSSSSPMHRLSNVGSSGQGKAYRVPTEEDSDDE